MKPFREHHILNIIEQYDEQKLPLDLFISNYFRKNKALGSKDRGEIAEIIYSLVRWKGLLEYLCPPGSNWEAKLLCLREIDPVTIQNDLSIPSQVRVSFPKELYELIVQSYGEEKTQELCFINNFPAPTTVRANILKISRDELLEKWKTLYSVSPTKISDVGIIFHKKINFFSLPEFSAGLFEVQDEGSQLLSQLVQAKPGDRVMDYCSGSGGKTLAFAPRLGGKGQIYLHDVRHHALLEAKKRLKRAGIQNAQIVLSDSPKLKKIKKEMDWVLVDVPCSGTGTFRRNPDMKWNFNSEMLKRLLGQQRTIFEKALSFMKPEGRIVYCTCSILKQENEDQIAHFLKTYNLEVDGQPFQSLPSKGGMDGFFGVILKGNLAADERR